MICNHSLSGDSNNLYCHKIDNYIDFEIFNKIKINSKVMKEL